MSTIHTRHSGQTSRASRDTGSVDGRLRNVATGRTWRTGPAGRDGAHRRGSRSPSCRHGSLGCLWPGRRLGAVRSGAWSPFLGWVGGGDQRRSGMRRKERICFSLVCGTLSMGDSQQGCLCAVYLAVGSDHRRCPLAEAQLCHRITTWIVVA